MTRQAAWAVFALVVGFGAVTWGATAFHLYAVSQSSAENVANDVWQQHNEDLSSHLSRYDSPSLPMVWVHSPTGWQDSKNALGATPPTGSRWVRPWSSQPLLLVKQQIGAWQIVVGWPMGSVFDVMRDLTLVLGIVGILAGVAGALLARWATGRMLVPVDRMSHAVAEMVRTRHVTLLPSWSDTEDEFNRLGQTFNQLLTHLQEQARREHQILSMAAHELRTPLQVLRGNLELLSDWGGLDPAIRQDSLEQSSQVIQRLIRLVADLLTLERAASPTDMPPETIALDPMLDLLAEDAHALAPALEVVRSGQTASIYAAVWAMERAIWAVLDNALKYTPDGGRIALVGVREARRAGVRIEDSGPGIPREELPRVFERFYRGAHATPHGGSGLGLAIARALTRSQGGDVDIWSEPGEGTAVTLWWPRTPESTLPED